MSDIDNQPLSPGTLLNQAYEVIALLEQDANTSIYCAADLTADREVWLYMLDTMHDISLRERFQLEAKVLGRLKHPNIIRLFNFEMAESGQTYMVLESLKGKRLSTLLAEAKQLSFDRALPIFVQLCDALRACHKVGILHRALKPHSVFLCEHNNNKEFVRIIDFANAKAADAGSDHFASSVLAPGIVPDNEPCYLSPEHILARPTTPQTDVYCLGLLILETLTGRPAYTGKQVKRLLREHEFLEPGTLAKLRPDLSFPSGLQDVVSRALQKEAAYRFQSVDELKNALLFIVGAESAEKLDTLLEQARSYLFGFLGKND